MRHLKIAVLAVTAVLSVSALGGSAFRHAAQRTGVGRNAAGRYRRACALGVRPVSLLGASRPVLGRPVLAAALWLLGLAPLGLARLGLASPLGLAAACYRARDAARTA